MASSLRHAALLSCILCSACAANLVRIESASSVAQLAAGVSKDVRGYFEQLGNRRRDANIALVAAIPNCRWGENLTLIVPRAPARVRCPAGPDDLAEARRNGFRQIPIDLRGIPEESLALAVAQLGVVTAYERALLSALEDKHSQLFDDLAFAATAAASIPGDLAKFGLPTDVISADQAKAAQELVGFVDKLHQEAVTVQALNKAVEEDGNKVAAALNALHRDLPEVARLYDVNTAIQQERSLQSAYDAEKNRLSFEERQRFVAAIASARSGGQEAVARIKPLQLAIMELQRGDAELRAALRGDFTPEQRRAIREENRRRLLRVVSLIAGLLPA